jgi:hypothetical protein
MSMQILSVRHSSPWTLLNIVVGEVRYQTELLVVRNYNLSIQCPSTVTFTALVNTLERLWNEERLCLFLNLVRIFSKSVAVGFWIRSIITVHDVWQLLEPAAVRGLLMLTGWLKELGLSDLLKSFDFRCLWNEGYYARSMRKCIPCSLLKENRFKLD